MGDLLNGIAASTGVAIAKAFVYKEPDLTIKEKTTNHPSEECAHLDKALDKARGELAHIQEKTRQELGEEKAEIFAAHLLVLSDPEFVEATKSKIETDRVTAAYALDNVAAMFVAMFENMDNDYMRERASDIRDVSRRVLRHLLGIDMSSLADIREDTVIIAHDLTPSDTAQLNPAVIKGFATNIGGRTSHSAIMSRSLEIPAVVGTKMITDKVENGMMIIVDGVSGVVIVDPTEEELTLYREKQADFQKQKAEWAKLATKKTMTQDHHHIELAANIGTPKDLEGVLQNGAEGIGLYRTEFLYMDRSELPSEEEQFAAYKEVVERMEGKPVVIRTLDIGGDKELSYLNLPEELNPFLGFRAIRLCLEREDIFRTQLRALLRASVFGNLKVMFPMIATLEELRAAKHLLEDEKARLTSEGIDTSDEMEVGIMVEIPSTAVAAEQFAQEVDFFSIGTNDLIQYTLAADRMNERVAYLYQPYHPAVLRLVQMVAEAAHKHGKWVGMCGEMAGDETAIPLLLGLGLDELSMSATSILPARSQLASIKRSEAVPLALEALRKGIAEEVKQLVQAKYGQATR
ncbi:phosphoenolpyruvate--protein phosphotransferase [Shouchella lonarensis]|uniref:Phosphoenolpyruvate-protein phosphotransferase n=1 Tax=Shouchella lonarensis TaxID=1464122 RepID=A0A1G6K1S2_9BACI|nr:phosphoenolpyruvate--protein phosphotransferase [Shouchella lonarensis]SDC24960.1 phosphoenolpyruvate--protein phosphotransferase [Shouchella lonarensis]